MAWGLSTLLGSWDAERAGEAAGALLRGWPADPGRAPGLPLLLQPPLPRCPSPSTPAPAPPSHQAGSGLGAGGRSGDSLVCSEATAPRQARHPLPSADSVSTLVALGVGRPPWGQRSLGGGRPAGSSVALAGAGGSSSPPVSSQGRVWGPGSRAVGCPRPAGGLDVGLSLTWCLPCRPEKPARPHSHPRCGHRVGCGDRVGSGGSWADSAGEEVLLCRVLECEGGPGPHSGASRDQAAAWVVGSAAHGAIFSLEALLLGRRSQTRWPLCGWVSRRSSPPRTRACGSRQLPAPSSRPVLASPGQRLGGTQQVWWPRGLGAVSPGTSSRTARAPGSSSSPLQLPGALRPSGSPRNLGRSGTGGCRGLCWGSRLEVGVLAGGWGPQAASASLWGLAADRKGPPRLSAPPRLADQRTGRTALGSHAHAGTDRPGWLRGLLSRACAHTPPSSLPALPGWVSHWDQECVSIPSGGGGGRQSPSCGPRAPARPSLLDAAGSQRRGPATASHRPHVLSGPPVRPTRGWGLVGKRVGHCPGGRGKTSHGPETASHTPERRGAPCHRLRCKTQGLAAAPRPGAGRPAGPRPRATPQPPGRPPGGSRARQSAGAAA